MLKLVLKHLARLAFNGEQRASWVFAAWAGDESILKGASVLAHAEVGESLLRAAVEIQHVIGGQVAYVDRHIERIEHFFEALVSGAQIADGLQIYAVTLSFCLAAHALLLAQADQCPHHEPGQREHSDREREIRQQR